jgi:hypothetical protein
MNTVPQKPKIYHIVHVDRLPSIVAAGFLWCDAEVIRHALAGTTIGMSRIKQRRLTLPLNSHPDLHVGDCVPFYFFPWHLIERIGVLNYTIYQQVVKALPLNGHRPTVKICEDWYYREMRGAQL